ncbi:hypothetical protein IRJ41_004756 [Triplophysa rosa]|uniref:Uncharacterized protein n=2 Tax=Triplophysa rosa TaxID=992332 RepID=A0A9W7T400_TRIRA|nr:hypothetical protein IRJ41_004756 [Triplophysa rosa]
MQALQIVRKTSHLGPDSGKPEKRPCNSLPLESSETNLKQKTVKETKPRKDREKVKGVQSDMSGSEDFQDEDLVFQFPTCTDQFRTPADLNPEAEPFRPVEERHGERQRKEIEETAEALPEDQRVVDPVTPEDQSELSVDSESENDDMDTPYLNTYPRRERNRP